jgi:hypothetical protein
MTGFKAHLPSNREDLITHESRKKAQRGSLKKDCTNIFGKPIFGLGTPVNILVQLVNRCMTRKKARSTM